MTTLLDPRNWPLWIVIVGMIVAAVIDGWKRIVPNWLTFSLVLSGWALGLLHSFGLRFDGTDSPEGVPLTGIGGIGASLACTALGFLLLFPLLLVRGMGRGDVKMQMGFGAWVGAFFGLERGVMVVLLAFCAGAIIGGLFGLAIMVYRRSYRENMQNMQLILMDAAVTGSLTKMAERGQNLRDRGPKLPYGVPLCIGFVGYLVYLYT